MALLWFWYFDRFTYLATDYKERNGIKSRESPAGSELPFTAGARTHLQLQEMQM